MLAAFSLRASPAYLNINLIVPLMDQLLRPRRMLSSSSYHSNGSEQLTHSSLDSLFGRQSLLAFGEHLSHQIDLGLLARQDGVGKRARPLMVAAIEHGFGHLQRALVVRDH